MIVKQISDELRSRLTSVRQIITWCEKHLTKDPPGRLRILKQNSAVYYYHVTDNKHRNGIMIDPKNQSLIKALAQKAYLISLLHKAQWLAQSYKHKEIDDDMTVYETINGERVRSKSEQLIADRLYFNGIPYIYEFPLIIGDMTFHPDFTILRMSDRRVLYYEHLGRMDDPGYSNKNTRRINIYSNNGIILGDNLFISMDTSLHPLDIRTVDRLIKTNFR